MHFLLQDDLYLISLPSGPFVAFAEIPDAGMLCSRLSHMAGPVYFCSYSGREVILGDSIQAAIIALEKTELYNYRPVCFRTIRAIMTRPLGAIWIRILSG